MRDWRGMEPVFQEGKLSLLEITEPQCVYQPIPEFEIWKPIWKMVKDPTREGYMSSDLLHLLPQMEWLDKNLPRREQ